MKQTTQTGETTMAAIDVTGKITKCEVKRYTNLDYNYMGKYSPNTERYIIRLNICLNICLETADGKRYFFDSPSFRMDVTNVVGASVVTYYPDQKDSENWFSEVKGSGVVTAEKTNTNSLEPLVKIGDTITVRGSIKAEKPTYTVLNRIKKV